MPYVAINSTNIYDPANANRYATLAEAEARATEILHLYPTSRVFTAQVVKEYSAVVTITASEPEATETPAE